LIATRDNGREAQGNVKVDMAASTCTYTLHDWRWVASALCDPRWPAPSLPLLDTVIIDGGRPNAWLALSSGSIVSKPLGPATATELMNTFSAFSMGYARNAAATQLVCVSHYAVGAPRVVDKPALATHITVGFLMSTCVQPFAMPQGCARLPTNLRFEYLAVPDHVLRDPSLPAVPLFRYVETADPAPGEASYRLLPAIINGADGKPLPGGPRVGAPIPLELFRRVETIVRQLVSYLQRSVPSERVVKLVAEFSVDDEGGLWLVFVPDVHTEANPWSALPPTVREAVSSGMAAPAPTVTLPDGRLITPHRMSVPDVPSLGIKDLTELRGSSAPHTSFQVIGSALLQLVTGQARDFKRSMGLLRGSGSDEVLASMRAIERTPSLLSIARLEALRPTVYSELFDPVSLKHVGQLAERVGGWCAGICLAALEFHGCPSWTDFPVLLAAMAEADAATSARSKLLLAGGLKTERRGSEVGDIFVPPPPKPSAAAATKTALLATMMSGDTGKPPNPLSLPLSKKGGAAGRLGGTAGGKKGEAPCPPRLLISTGGDSYVPTAGGGATGATAGLGMGPRQAFAPGKPSGLYGVSESGTFVCADGTSSVEWVVLGARDPARPALQSLIIVGDVWDSWERTAALVAPLVPHAAHVLLANLPGQPGTVHLTAAPSPVDSPGSTTLGRRHSDVIGGLAEAAGALPVGSSAMPLSTPSVSPTMGFSGLFSATSVAALTKTQALSRSSSPTRLAPAPLELPLLELTHIATAASAAASAAEGVIGDADASVRAARAVLELPDGSFRPPGTGPHSSASRSPPPPAPSPAVLNNEFHASALEQLLLYLDAMRLFRTTSASWGYDVVGMGLGGSAALAWTARYGRPHNRRGQTEQLYVPKDKSGREVVKQLAGLRSLTLVNTPAWLDPQLKTILESSKSVLGAFPPDKPDLPVSYFSRFLFSDRYLSAVQRETANAIYASSPRTKELRLATRVELVAGALAAVDMRPFMPGLGVPLIVLQGSADALVSARSATDLSRARSRGVPTTTSTGYPTLVEVDGDPFRSPIALTKPDMGLGGAEGAPDSSGFRRLPLTAPQSMPLPTPPGTLFYDTLLSPEAILRVVAAVTAPGKAPPDTCIISLACGHEVRQERPTALLDLLRALIDCEGVLRTVQRVESGDGGPPPGPDGPSGGGDGGGRGGGDIQGDGEGRGSPPSGRRGSRSGSPGGSLGGGGGGGVVARGKRRGSVSGRRGSVGGASSPHSSPRNLPLSYDFAGVLASLPLRNPGGRSPLKPKRRPSATLAAPLHDPSRETRPRTAEFEELESSDAAEAGYFAAGASYWLALPSAPAPLSAGLILAHNVAPIDEAAVKKAEEAAARAAMGLDDAALAAEKAAHTSGVQDRLLAAQAARRAGWDAEDKAVIGTLMRASAARRQLRDAKFKEVEAFGAIEALAGSVKVALVMQELTERNGPTPLPTLPLGPPRVDSLSVAAAFRDGAEEPGGPTTYDAVTKLTAEEFEEIREVPFAILRAQAAAAAEAEAANALLRQAELELLQLSSAIRLQCWWRMKSARILRRMLRLRRLMSSAETRGAIRLQRAYRGHRTAFREMRYRREQRIAWTMHHAAIQLQRLLRGYLVRMSIRALVLDRGARSVQRIFRGWRDRMLVRLVRAAREGAAFHNKCALLIQSAFKGWHVRGSYRELRMVVLAATQVQRWVRGHAARVEVHRLRQMKAMPAGVDKVNVGMSHLIKLQGTFDRARGTVDKFRRALFRCEDEVANAKLAAGRLRTKLALIDDQIAAVKGKEGELKQVMVDQEKHGVDRALKSRGGAANSAVGGLDATISRSPSPRRKKGGKGEGKESGSPPPKGMTYAELKARKNGTFVRPPAPSLPEAKEERPLSAMPSGAALMKFDGSNLTSSRFEQGERGAKHTGPRIDGDKLRRLALGIGCALPFGLQSIVRGQDVLIGRKRAHVDAEYRIARAEVDYEAELALRGAYAERGKRAAELQSERVRVVAQLEAAGHRVKALISQAEGISAALKRNNVGFDMLQTHATTLAIEQKKHAADALPPVVPYTPSLLEIAVVEASVNAVQAVSNAHSNALTAAADRADHFMRAALPQFAAGAATIATAARMNREALAESVNHDEIVMEALLGPLHPTKGLLGGGMSTNTRVDLHIAVRDNLAIRAAEESRVGVVEELMDDEEEWGLNVRQMRAAQSKRLAATKGRTSSASSSVRTSRSSGGCRDVPAASVTQLLARTGLSPGDFAEAAHATKKAVKTGTTGLPPSLLATGGHVLVGGVLVPVTTATRVQPPRRLPDFHPSVEVLGDALQADPRAAVIVSPTGTAISAGVVAERSFMATLRIAAATREDVAAAQAEFAAASAEAVDALEATAVAATEAARTMLLRPSHDGNVNAAARRMSTRPGSKRRGSAGSSRTGSIAGSLSGTVAGSGARAVLAAREGVHAQPPAAADARATASGEGTLSFFADRSILPPVTSATSRASSASTLHAFELPGALEKKSAFAAEEAETAADTEEAAVRVTNGSWAPRKLRDWTADHVCLWLRALGLRSAVPVFESMAVDGEFLPSLSAVDMRDKMAITDKRVLATLLTARDALLEADVANDCNRGIGRAALAHARGPKAGLTGPASVLLAALESIKIPALSILLAFAAAGRTRKLEAYVRAGQDVNAQDERGNTMLIMAAAHGHALLVDLLLSRGADPSIVNALGNNCLHYVVDPARREQVDPAGKLEKSLVLRGANPRAVNLVGRMPDAGIRPEDAAVDPVIGGLPALEGFEEAEATKKGRAMGPAFARALAAQRA
jgi:hypothetical protein